MANPSFYACEGGVKICWKKYICGGGEKEGKKDKKKIRLEMNG